MKSIIRPRALVLPIVAAVAACGGDNATGPTPTPSPSITAASLKVYPTAVATGIGHVMHVHASGFTSDGALLTGGSYTFNIANSNIASIDPASGAVTGLTAGSTTLTVRSGSATQAIPITVGALGTGTFRIDLRFGPHVSSTLQAAAQAAAARWQNVITAPLVPYIVTMTANDAAACNTPVINEVVPNMIIYIKGDTIDGPNKTVGEASPCIIRDDAPQTTALGELTVDTADVNSLARAGLLLDLMTHEMGHILGIGTLWGPAPFGFFPGTATGLGSTDPEYTGRQGRIAAARLGFTADSTAPVPIENTGGEGTADGHWRETLFKHELMTGTLDNDANPLSLVTIGALADMGYVVAPEAEEDITVNNAGSPLLFSGASGDLLVGNGASYRIIEKLHRPRFAVKRSGLVTPVGAASSKAQPKQ